MVAAFWGAAVEQPPALDVTLAADTPLWDCGTTLTWEGDGEELGLLVEIHMGTLDDPNVHAPKCHVHHDERISGFDAAGSLPRYHEWEVDEGPYRSDPAV